MHNILLNSLNKKILAIAVILFVIGSMTQTFQKNIGNRYHNKVYMYEEEKENKALLIEEEEILIEQEGIDIKFLPVSEVEQVLRDYEYNKLYVETDPHFDQKVKNIQTYMSRRNSPLTEKAGFLVMMSNKFKLDYRLVPAISIIESSGGIKLYRKYNAWGWGGANGFTFENWEHSIYVVSRGLGRYYASGAVTPEQIAPRYNPHTPNEWGAKVRMVMGQIGPKL